MSAPPVPLLGPFSGSPAELVVLVAAAALLPALLATLTAFLKISVVLSLLRHAVGAPQVPSNGAVTGLALLLALAVMAPVAEAALEAARAAPARPGIDGSLERARRAAEPLRAFLARHARPADRDAFAEVARRTRAPARAAEASRDDFAVLAPAFVVSELRRAFTIGFVVFVPFLVVDLVVANVLIALGLSQLSPTAVALPFKLLLLVGVDGWRLLATSLVLSYAP